VSRAGLEPVAHFDGTQVADSIKPQKRSNRCFRRFQVHGGYTTRQSRPKLFQLTVPGLVAPQVGVIGHIANPSLPLYRSATVNCELIRNCRPLCYEPKAEVTEGNPAPSTSSVSQNVVAPSYLTPPRDGHTVGHTEHQIQRSLVRGPPGNRESAKPAKSAKARSQIESRFAVRGTSQTRLIEVGNGRRRCRMSSLRGFEREANQKCQLGKSNVDCK